MSTTAPAPAADGLRFFGPFAALHALDLPQTAEGDLYEGFHASLYDVLTLPEQWDVERYLTESEGLDGPLLELACGSGRIALPLARAGREVHGLDLAEDMLGVLAKRAAAEDAETRARLHVGVADMTSFALEQRFGLIILGATSICLLHQPEQRVAMFTRVREHLAEGGRFLFDFSHLTPEALARQDGETVAVPAVGPNAKRFTLIGQQWLREENVQLVNFYSEMISGDGATKRFLGSTAKAVLDQDDLLAEAAQAGLHVDDVSSFLAAGPAEGEEIRLVSCRAA
jgi:SAM-dependent methyltransferase